uniref:hypothetical protein n=1 Tax=Aeromonas caviae TaxID=648 RepID=UPI002B4A91CC
TGLSSLPPVIYYSEQLFRHMPLTMIDGFGGWVNNQPSEAATVAVLEQMRLLLGELENQITKK